MVAGALLTLYLAVPTAIFGYVRYRRGIEGARWVDIAVPWRWPLFQVARGEHYLAAGQARLAQGDFRDAARLLRHGLQLSPANRDGRLALANLLQQGRQPDFAKRTYLGGLTFHHADPAFVKPLLTFLLQRQDDAQVAMLAERYGRQLPARSEAARLFALAAATASYFRGNYDRAEDFLQRMPRLAASRDGRLLGAKIEWDRGYRELALVEWRQLADESPGDAEIHRDFVQHLRLAQRSDEARRRSLAFQIAHPALAGPRIELLRAYFEAGETVALTREIEALLRDCAEDQSAVLALADYAANAGDVALADRLVQHAATRPWPAEAFVGLAIEARIVAGKYRAALERIRDCRGQENTWSDGHEALLESLEAVAAFGAAEPDASKTSLSKLLERRNLRADNLLALANRFVSLDAVEPARQLLQRAVATDPLNQAAVTRLVQLDLVSNRPVDLAVDVRRLVQMRQPPPDVLRYAEVKLGTDVLLFSREAPAALAAVRAALAKSRGH